jgi:hypothetical protein
MNGSTQQGPCPTKTYRERTSYNDKCASICFEPYPFSSRKRPASRGVYASGVSSQIAVHAYSWGRIQDYTMRHDIRHLTNTLDTCTCKSRSVRLLRAFTSGMRHGVGRRPTPNRKVPLMMSGAACMHKRCSRQDCGCELTEKESRKSTRARWPVEYAARKLRWAIASTVRDTP